MTAIRVRGARDPYEIAAVVALLTSRDDHPPAPTGVAAWQRTRRAALAPRAHRRPHAERDR